MTEPNTTDWDKIPPLKSTLPTTTELNLDTQKSQWPTEFKNILPRIDYILQIPNPNNSKEIRHFQKQVNTDGTSKTGRYPIPLNTYNFAATKHTNVVNLGNQTSDRPSWLNNIWSEITSKGKYDGVLDALNKNEDKNKQVRIEASKQYLANLAENPASNTDPKLAAFVTKVETALGK